MADWALIVGEELAAATLPRKLAGGTLTVACAGPMALELQHRADVLIGRINTHMGHRLVERLRLVQAPVGAVVARLGAGRQAGAEEVAAVERAVADVAPGELREALVRLGLAVRMAR
jgi:hypothetical protein